MKLEKKSTYFLEQKLSYLINIIFLTIPSEIIYNLSIIFLLTTKNVYLSFHLLPLQISPMQLQLMPSIMSNPYPDLRRNLRLQLSPSNLRSQQSLTRKRLFFLMQNKLQLMLIFLSIRYHLLVKLLISMMQFRQRSLRLLCSFLFLIYARQFLM